MTFFYHNLSLFSKKPFPLNLLQGPPRVSPYLCRLAINRRWSLFASALRDQSRCSAFLPDLPLFLRRLSFSTHAFTVFLFPAVMDRSGAQLFSGGALEPGVRAARAAGAGRAGVPQLSALSAARPRRHRPPQLPQRPHGCMVSSGGLRLFGVIDQN